MQHTLCPGAAQQRAAGSQHCAQSLRPALRVAPPPNPLPLLPPHSVAGCERKPAIAQQVCSVAMQDFQGRLQRCVQRCQDQAQESLPSNPSQKDISKAQVRLG